MFVVLLSVALADLPVHCLRHQVVGAWRLHLGALAKERSTCGHTRPDVESKQPPLKLNGTTSWDIQLHDPNVASADGHNGSWTMVYDEGFYADLGGRTFFAFNHFMLSDPNSVHWFEPRVHGKKVYRSVCGRTEVGWYHDKASDQWGCFTAERSDVNPDAHHDYLSFLHVVEDPAYHAPLSLAQHEAVAARINAVADGWTAAADTRYAGLSLADLNRKAGTARYNTRQESQSFLSTRDGHRAHVVRAEPAVAPAKADAMPEEFSWRSHNGSDWLDPVMDQGECGSCYAVSSTNMMTARHRVAMSDPKAPSFSVGFSLYCADVNQGCNGGYPFLTAMWSQNVGLVQSSCTGRYRVDTNLQCENFVKHAEAIKGQQLDKCMAGHEARVTDFSYVGGYYGGCSEAAMKESLLEGPITVAIEPGMDFMYYKSGVYRSVKKDEKVQKPSGEWVKVDHAVLLVGWGVDKSDPKEPRPYWLVQNSWGPDWGEGGYIRMARGENESGVEFQALAATVKPAEDKPLHAFLAHERK
jgi:cathepsin C